MKTLSILLLIMLPLVGQAQHSPLDAFFDKYSGKQGYTVITFTKEMFNLYAGIDDTSPDQGSADATKGVNFMKMLTVTPDSTLSTHFNNELRSLLPKNKYKELMVIKDANSTISFLTRQEGNRIKEFIMIIDGESPVVIYIEGDMDPSQLAKLSGSMDIKGMENLDDAGNAQ
jgi:hypothetical protein